MSDYVPMHEYQLLPFGFCRESEKRFNITIPNYLVRIIMKYQIKYVVFGIGDNHNGELGLDDNQRQIFTSPYS